MALPDNNTPFPPPSWAAIRSKYDEWAAWWEGDEQRLTGIYQSQPGAQARPSQYAGGVAGAVARFFWGKPRDQLKSSTRLHLPLAADLAATSAEQVYATPPVLTASDNAGQTTLEQAITDGFTATLMEGAESGAVLGGRFHAVTRDPSVHNGRPFLTTIHADQALPEFRWGELTAVTFVWTIEARGEQRVRHLERHELNPAGHGIILHGLYRGTRTSLGERIPLTDHPDTAALADALTADGETLNLPATPGLWCAYIPNMRPQRRWRTHPTGRYLGRSDLDGIEPWLDRIDAVYSELADDVDLTRGRLIVDEALIDTSPDFGAGTGFDLDRRIFTPVGSSLGDKPLMQEVQFTARVNELMTTIQALTEKVITTAGWSLATFGEHDGDTDITATEVRAREARTLSKRARRINEETQHVTHLARKLLDLDGLQGRTVTVEWSATVAPDLKELAETAQMLKVAQAASTYQRVKMVHPDWGEPQIVEEVARIHSDGAAPLPDQPWTPARLLTTEPLLTSTPDTDEQEETTGA